MIVTDAIELLKHEELKQLKVAEDTSAVIGFINLGILGLHKRFALWEEDAVITMVDGVTSYLLDGIDSNVSIDLSNKELILVQKVFDEDGNEVILSEETKQPSTANPKFNQVKVHEDLKVQTLDVIYRATPKFLTAETETIPLPIQFFEALFLYVGYKGHISIKADIKDENNTYYVRFNAACTRIEIDGIGVQQDLSSTKFIQRGFV